MEAPVIEGLGGYRLMALTGGTRWPLAREALQALRAINLAPIQIPGEGPPRCAGAVGAGRNFD